MNIIKRINVMPFHANFAHCLDECMISLTKYFERDFILMYSQAWGFSFIEKFYQNQSTGYSLDPDRGEIYELLHLYYGTKITFTNQTESNKVMQIIIDQLDNGNPVGVSMDTFYYSWDPNKNQHGKHWFLITGVDTEKKLFYCTDPFFEKKDLTLEFENFLNGYLGVYFTINIGKQEINEFSWKDIINKTIKKLSGQNTNGKSIFDNMNDCAQYIETKLSLDNETKGYDRIIDMPFYVKFQAISRGRRQYAMFLEYIASEYNVKDLNKVAEKLRYASNKWENIRGIMVKGIISSNESIIKDKLPSKIRNIAKYENDIFNLMSSIVEQSNYSKNHIVSGDENYQSLNDDKDDENYSLNYTYLNLEKYFNNNGFDSMLNKQSNANLNGTGLFFLSEDIPSGEILNIENMSFKFPKLVSGTNDNISCAEQVINVPNIKCNNLMILATADFGSYNDTLTLTYEDGTQEQIYISCTEYLFEPMYGESVAWKGSACERTDNNISIYNSEVRIFAKNYRLSKPGKITQIELPYLPNIHIFSITIK